MSVQITFKPAAREAAKLALITRGFTVEPDWFGPTFDVGGFDIQDGFVNIDAPDATYFYNVDDVARIKLTP